MKLFISHFSRLKELKHFLYDVEETKKNKKFLAFAKKTKKNLWNFWVEKSGGNVNQKAHEYSCLQKSNDGVGMSQNIQRFSHFHAWKI